MKHSFPGYWRFGKKGGAALAAIAAGITGSSMAYANRPLPVPTAPVLQNTSPVHPATPSLPTPDSKLLPLTNSWRNPQIIRTLNGHSAPVDALAFSPDGKLLISGGSSNEGNIRVWSLTTGRQIDSIRAHRTSVIDMALSSNGEILASCGDDAGVNLWNWKTGKYTRTFLEHSSNVLSLAMTPDSQMLVTGGLDGIRVWDLFAQRPLYNLVRFDNPTYSLAVNPDGIILASGMKNGTIKLWNLATGRLLSTISEHRGPVNAIAFTSDGQRLISGGYDRTIAVRNLTTGRLDYTLTGHTGAIGAISLNPDGETLASASRDGVRLWNLKTGEQLAFLTGHQDWVQSVAFSRDGRLLASGGYDRAIEIWQVPPTTIEP
jgi:COMPASS component SWD3